MSRAPSVLLTVEEARTFLRLGRSKTYQLIACGHLPAVRIGRSVRVPEAAIHELVERCTVGGSSTSADPNGQ